MNDPAPERADQTSAIGFLNTEHVPPARMADHLRNVLKTAPTGSCLSSVHRQYAPQLAYGRHLGPALPTAREAAVLVLLYPDAMGNWHITLTRRPATMSTHADQVSFPGGVREAGESPVQCAEREWHEELGAPGVGWTVVGQLTPLYVFASNFLVIPCVYVAEAAPHYTPNPDEVAAVIELPFEQLVAHQAEPAEQLMIRRAGLRFHAPCLTVGEHVIWGATCMMLGELRYRFPREGVSDIFKIFKQGRK